MTETGEDRGRKREGEAGEKERQGERARESQSLVSPGLTGAQFGITEAHQTAHGACALHRRRKRPCELIGSADGGVIAFE